MNPQNDCIKSQNDCIKSQNDCIYYFLPDEVRPKPKKNGQIHKIIVIDFFIRNELTNVKKIKKINNYKSYYYVCENSSELKITNLEEDIRHIRDIREIKSDETMLLKFEDLELIYLKNYLKALSSSRKYIFAIIDFYKGLLKTIGLLVEQQIVHNNINFESIVVDKNQLPLISNFSLSLDMSREDFAQYIKHFIITYDPSYLEWPLEFHILSYLLTNKLNSLSSYNIEYIINEVTTNNNILKTFGLSIVSSYKLEAMEYFKKYVNQTYEYILADVLQYFNTWDNYALSIMFLRVLIGIHRSTKKQNKFIIFFMKLLVSNIHLNPCKRLSVSSTTNKFESLLEDLDPKDYKELLINLMSA